MCFLFVYFMQACNQSVCRSDNVDGCSQDLFVIQPDGGAVLTTFMFWPVTFEPYIIFGSICVHSCRPRPFPNQTLKIIIINTTQDNFCSIVITFYMFFNIPYHSLYNLAWPTLQTALYLMNELVCRSQTVSIFTLITDAKKETSRELMV